MTAKTVWWTVLLLVVVVSMTDGRPAKQLIRVKRLATDRHRNTPTPEPEPALNNDTSAADADADGLGSERREEGSTNSDKQGLEVANGGADDVERTNRSDDVITTGDVETSNESVEDKEIVGNVSNDDDDDDDKDDDDDDDDDDDKDDDDDEDSHIDDTLEDEINSIIKLMNPDYDDSTLVIDPLDDIYDDEDDDEDDDDDDDDLELGDDDNDEGETFWEYIMNVFHLDDDWQEQIEEETQNGYYSNHEDEEGYLIDNPDDDNFYNNGEGYSLEEADVDDNEDASAKVTVQVVGADEGTNTAERLKRSTRERRK